MSATPPLRFVVLGLSITSSWGNGHAVTYRSLLSELAARGHDVLFLERDVPWYAAHRDLTKLPFGRLALYRGVAELKRRHLAEIAKADVVIVGSYVPDGVEVTDLVLGAAEGAVAFYDIDTPVTLSNLERGVEEYVAKRQIAKFALYLSFTGGPVLARLARAFGARRPRPLYCSVDPETYRPEPRARKWEVGYLGTWSADRQPVLDELLLSPARRLPIERFVVAGSLYPDGIAWPRNVQRIDHVPPYAHRAFYNAQRFTLNVTRADMVKSGWSPSVRLFEAAACATTIISDDWPGLETFFVPGREILIARSGEEVLRILRQTSDARRLSIGERARKRVLAAHTAAHRAAELEEYALEALGRSRARRRA